MVFPCIVVDLTLNLIGEQFGKPSSDMSSVLRTEKTDKRVLAGDHQEVHKGTGGNSDLWEH